MTEITVIRKITSYEEIVFESQEEFEEWKALATSESIDDEEKFEEFNDDNFQDIEYDTSELSPIEYVALKGDQRIASDDWIFWGIFNEAKEAHELNSLNVIDSVSEDDYGDLAPYMNHLLTD